MKNFYLLAFVALLLSGCATQTYYVNDNRGGNKTNPEQEISQPFFVSGIAQQRTMDAAEICGGAEKVAKVESKLNFLDGLLGFITLGIYTPRTAMVYCTQS